MIIQRDYFFSRKSNIQVVRIGRSAIQATTAIAAAGPSGRRWTSTKVAHFIFDFSNEIRCTTGRREYDSQTWTCQQSTTAIAIGFAGRSWPQPKRCRRDRRDNGYTLGRCTEKATVGLGSNKDTARHGCGDSTDADNLVKGDVDFNVTNPEAEGTIGSHIDRPDQIVPKPCQQNQVGNGDGNDSAVCANRDGCDHEYYKDRFKDNELDFET